MRRDVLSEEYYDEVCRVIGDAVIVLAEEEKTTQRSTLTALLQQTLKLRADAGREEQKVLEHAIRLIRPTTS